MISVPNKRNRFKCGIHLLVNLKFVLASFVLAHVRVPFLEWCLVHGATHLVGSSASDLPYILPIPTIAELSYTLYRSWCLAIFKAYQSIKKTSNSGWTIVKRKSPKLENVPGGFTDNFVSLSNSFQILFVFEAFYSDTYIGAGWLCT